MSNRKPNSLKLDPKPSRLLTSKPFCDCRSCMCENCPDILQMLSIHVTDTTCHFRSKVEYNDVGNPKPEGASESANLLDALNQARKQICSCDIVARGVRDDVHMNIGLTERREEIIKAADNCTHCIGNIVPDTSASEETSKPATRNPSTTENDNKTISTISGSTKETP